MKRTRNHVIKIDDKNEPSVVFSIADHPKMIKPIKRGTGMGFLSLSPTGGEGNKKKQNNLDSIQVAGVQLLSFFFSCCARRPLSFP